MAIALAMEIPTAKLSDWSTLADLDFVLAHVVLADREYADFFRRRPFERELILDNSYHELGYPLPMSDLLEAANRCRADYVISPDRVGDVEFNADQFRIARTMLQGYKLAVVMTNPPSNDMWDRENYLFSVRDAEMLCCTFKEPRRFENYIRSPTALRWSRVHLLGCAELSELTPWSHIARSSVKKFSMDTGKALKHAMRGSKMDELETVRFSAGTTEKGLPSMVSQEILNLAPEQLARVPGLEDNLRHNVKVLRRYLA